MSRKPDGRSQLNRLSPDRQAAVADYGASHTLPETVEWLNGGSQRSKLKLGLEVIAEALRDHPEAQELYERFSLSLPPPKAALLATRSAALKRTRQSSSLRQPGNS